MIEPNRHRVDRWLLGSCIQLDEVQRRKAKLSERGTKCREEKEPLYPIAET